eukprot:32969-Chlamydomonas_euryale.AAC.1
MLRRPTPAATHHAAPPDAPESVCNAVRLEAEEALVVQEGVGQVLACRVARTDCQQVFPDGRPDRPVLVVAHEDAADEPQPLQHTRVCGGKVRFVGRVLKSPSRCSMLACGGKARSVGRTQMSVSCCSMLACGGKVCRARLWAGLSCSVESWARVRIRLRRRSVGVQKMSRVIVRAEQDKQIDMRTAGGM